MTTQEREEEQLESELSTIRKGAEELAKLTAAVVKVLGESGAGIS